MLNLVLTEGDFEGTLDAAWDRVRGASSFEIQTSVDPITPTSWAFKQSASKSSATIQGLTSGAKLWVHVRAIGAGLFDHYKNNEWRQKLGDSAPAAPETNSNR